MSYQNSVLIAVLLGFFLLWPDLCRAQNPNLITAVEPPPYMKACMTDDECISVDPQCDNCCGSAEINKRFEKDYGEFKAKQCHNHQGGVCDCAPTTDFEVKCTEGRCAKSKIRPMKIDRTTKP